MSAHRPTRLLFIIILAGLMFPAMAWSQDAKWTQAPSTNFPGLHAHDFAGGTVSLGDDWICEGGNVSSIRWWGNFELDVTGGEMRGAGVAGFQLLVLLDDPAGSCLPIGEPLWQLNVSASEVLVSDTGLVNLEGSPIYEYLYILQQPFEQQQGEHYWLAMWAVAVDTQDPPLWRWQESDRTQAPVLCGAVENTEPVPDIPATIIWPGDLMTDLAFELNPPGDTDLGDAPEGQLAYPSTGVIGAFPTCKTVGPAPYVEHGLCWGHFGPACDFELDGNAGFCPVFTPNGYDRDECFADGDAGLLIPDAFTIIGGVGAEVVVPCPSQQGIPLGRTCNTANWGADVDILVVNGMPVDAYVNVLIDWSQDGMWSGSSSCPRSAAPEHVLVDFPVPIGYSGPLSGLGPPSFLIGPNSDYVWARFSITESPVGPDWDGSGVFEDGETEDYLLLVERDPLQGDCEKWLQPPDCDVGINVDSYRIYTAPPDSGPVVADDWLCDGRPVTGLRWWGSYRGWLDDEPVPDASPPPPPERPIGFFVTWYTDVPANGSPFSHPGGIIATNYYPMEEAGRPGSVPGLVYEAWYCMTPRYDGPGLVEHEYEYVLRFPEDEEWLEKEGNIYWVSIEAVYQPTLGTFPWGWKTTPPEYHWNDDATYTLNWPPVWNPLVYPTPFWTAGHPYDGLTVDQAFGLLTDVCPGRCKKWEQPPDMEYGEDMPSSEFNGQGPLRADDFISDGRPITDIHWWGSYIGWLDSTEGGSETNPVLPPGGLNRVFGFVLSWHEHVEDPPLGFPGNLLTNIFVGIDNCHEVYYGTVTQSWLSPPGEPIYEHEYQYYVDLIDPMVSDGPWLEREGTHYWVNIQAVLEDGWTPGEVHDGWGWKLSPITNLFGAVVSQDGGGSWNLSVRDPTNPRQDPAAVSQPHDLSFELTTSQIHTNDRPVFTNIHHNPLLGYMMVSTGAAYCGKQILQGTTNLNLGHWHSIYTNPVPTQVNQWRSQSAYSSECYRILVTP